MSKQSEAKILYQTLCQTLDNMQWHYGKEEEALIVHTSAVGANLSIKLVVRIDTDRQVMFLKSPMTFVVPESARNDVGKAVVLANYTMLNGSFEFNFADGYLGFKMVVPYMESLISEAVCKYMIVLSCSMTDKFNDKFKSIAEGNMTLDEFETFVKK